MIAPVLIFYFIFVDWCFYFSYIGELSSVCESAMQIMFEGSNQVNRVHFGLTNPVSC